MLLHVRQNERIGIRDEKSVSEDLDDGADVEVLWAVELGPLRRASRLGDARLFQEFAADHSRVLNRRLVDRNHVVRQTIGNNKAPPFVQKIWSVLENTRKILFLRHPLQSESLKSQSRCPTDRENR